MASPCSLKVNAANANRLLESDAGSCYLQRRMMAHELKHASCNDGVESIGKDVGVGAADELTV